MSGVTDTPPGRPTRRHRSWRAATILLASLLACGLAGGAWAQSKPNARAFTLHQVQEGDSLELLAAEYYGDRRHKIYLMIENGLDHGRPLKRGEKLRIPVSNEITVAVGDTLASLATQYLGDERRAKYLAKFNGLPPDTSLAAGMSLTIPLRVTYRSKGTESLKAIAAALFADAEKAALLRDYNFLTTESLPPKRAIVVPIFLRMQPSKRRPPDAESTALVAKRSEVLARARNVLPGAHAAWRDGDYAAVKRDLAELVASFPYLDTEVVVDAGVLLGAAYVAFEDIDTARATFEQVLARNPKHSLSAYQHSPKVCKVWQDAGGTVDEPGR